MGAGRSPRSPPSRRRGRGIGAHSGRGHPEVSYRPDGGWGGHRPGQVAFATFDRVAGAHPFTIASADRGDRRITFEIKALGDDTRGLAQRLQPGQAVKIDGPFGRFDLPTGRGHQEALEMR